MKTITPKWYENLSPNQSPSFWVNSVGISNDAGRVVAATFFHDYSKPGSGPNEEGAFGTYCYDANGNQLWRDRFQGMDGVFGVAISGDGKIAAAGGWLYQNQALLRAYDAADGTNLLDYTQIQQRVNCVSLSNDGSVLAAAADDVYLFVKTGSAFPTTPVKMGIAGVANNFVASVAVEPGGKWLAACDTMGNVHLGVISGGGIQNYTMWTAPRVRFGPPKPDSTVPFLAVQAARDGRSFVVGGGDFVYLFDADALLQGKQPIQYDTRDANTPGPTANGTERENVRWVAISGDGAFVTAVANRLNAGKELKAGLLVALALEDGQLYKVWEKALDRNPNSTSMNAAGTYISLADGYPVDSDSNFRLFDRDGNELWSYPTHNMNWPMVMSPCGPGIAAGGDDGNLYYLSEP